MTTKRAPKAFIPCTPMPLPPELLIPAAQTARAINPANDPPIRRVIEAVRLLLGLDRDADVPVQPQHIALLTTAYWGAGGVKLTVGFVERTVPELQAKIVSYMNRWGTRANVTFTVFAGGNWQEADVRISRGAGGYYSYLGTGIKQIPRGQQTMNLEGFTLRTPDSEYERVVCHETGHSLGFPHEHMRADLVRLLDPAKTIAYFGRTQGWSAQEVRQQVLTPLNEASLMATPADQDSIMCYQIPGECTLSGQPIHGGAGINESDFGFVAKVYPKAGGPPPPPPAGKTRVVIELDGTATGARVVSVGA